MTGLIKPTLGLPLAAACSLTRAAKPAHNGAAALVPLAAPCSPLFTTTQMLSATQATSGRFRLIVEPPLLVISIPCCQPGIAKLELLPPPLPTYVPSGCRPGSQTVSDCQAPPAALVVKNVPPTTVIFVLSVGE